MDLILARIDQLEEQARQQASTIEAQRSSLALLSSNVSCLASENESLRSKNEEQDRVIGQLSRSVVPGGQWVWEVLPWGERKSGAEPEGRWAWSLEKYRPNDPPSLAPQAQRRRAHPKPTLTSLPASILQSIVSLLGRRGRLTLCGVSSRLLEVAGRQLYRDVCVYPPQAISLVTSRLLPLAHPRQLRIRSLLAPHRVTFLSIPNYELPFGLPSPTSSNHQQLAIECLWIVLPGQDREISRWSAFLQLLNPRIVVLAVKSTSRPSTPTVLPTLSRLNLDTVAWLGHWKGIRELRLRGAGSVAFLRGRQRLAFRDCLERAAVSMGKRPSDVETSIVVNFRDGTSAKEVMKYDASLERRLGKSLASIKPVKEVCVRLRVQQVVSQ